jgi:WD40 repeat protein
VAALALAPGGKLLAAVSPEGKVRLWNLVAHKEAAILQTDRPAAHCLLFSADGKTLITGGRDRAVRLWEVETGQELLALEGHAEMVTALAFDPGARLLVSGGADKALRLWWGTAPPGSDATPLPAKP